MSDLVTQIAVLETQMKQIAKQVDEGFSNNSKEHKEIVELFERAMEKKANAWVEKVMVGVLTTIGLAFLGGLIALVIK
jgi:hypothetical protein